MAGPGQEMANVNFSRYSSAVFMVAHKEVWRMFDWLHRHHYRHRPPAYVGQRLQESEGGMKWVKGKEKAALQREEDPSTMDINMLYLLLQHTCGLRQEDEEFKWTSPSGEEQQQSLEHQLYLIKEIRNDLCHHPDQFMHLSDQRLDCLLQELMRLLCHSLQEAGQRSAQPSEEVEAVVTSVKNRLANIQASVPHSAILPQEFALFARMELQEQWEGLSTREQQLSPPLLRWALKEAGEATLDQLLQGPGGEEKESPQVLVVLGETGIGKSSLCWQVVEAWLQGEAWLGEAAAVAVEVVVVVEWRQVFTRDLTHLLLVDLLPQTCRRCHPEEVLGLLEKLRVLWLLDGFEEASADARELLRRLAKWCSTSSHVLVVTCQPEYREELEACLAPAPSPCYVTHCGLTQKGFHSLLATLLQDGQEAAGEAMENRAEAGVEDMEKEAKGKGMENREESGGEETGGEDKVKEREERKSGTMVGVEVQCQAFLKEVLALDPNLLRELHNPLKLRLVVQLWEEDRLNEAAGAPLCLLYSTIQEALVAKLVARLQIKSYHTEEEVRCRVELWVAGLCGAALAMWGRGCFVALDEAAEQLLRKRAIELMLPYTDCFSTFLVRRSGPGPKYSFLHHTQQSVLAAQHLHALLLQDHTTQELTALMVPGPPTTSTSTAGVDAVTSAMSTLTITAAAAAAAANIPTTLDHFLDILMHAATSLAAEGNLSEGRAKVLAELLEHCRHCPWLEVVKHTACCPTLAREVRPRLTERWKVTDPYVQVAAVLAGIQAPAEIFIELHNSPDDLPYLLPLLHCLAKAPVRVLLESLHSIYPQLSLSPCDSLLLPLCDPASLCCLVHFGGMLTAEGCRTLRQQRHNLVTLGVGVLELATLEELIQLTYDTQQLHQVVIHLYSIFSGLPSKSVSPRVDVHLYLEHVEDKKAEDAVILARRINHKFRRIMLGRVSPSAVCSMVRAFRKERVRTQSLGRIICLQIVNLLHFAFIHFYPLPLPTNVSLSDVYKAWKDLKMQVNVKVEVPSWVAGQNTAADTTEAVKDSSSYAGCGGGSGP